MATLNEMVEYLDKKSFVKFTNVDDFPSLDPTTQSILKNYGVVSDEDRYPYLVTDGKLKLLDNGLIQIGTGRIDYPKCINSDNEVVGFDLDENTIYLINTSLQKYIECLYIYRKYSHEIEWEETLGEYWENHKIYAKKLQDMLEAVEPDVMNTSWGIQVYERDLGVI